MKIEENKEWEKGIFFPQKSDNLKKLNVCSKGLDELNITLSYLTQDVKKDQISYLW